MQDAIIREITVKASQERVYQAITDPAEIIKWFPDAIEGGTLEVVGGTKVTLKESGFSSLPQSEAESSFKDNNGGWDYMVERLSALLD